LNPLNDTELKEKFISLSCRSLSENQTINFIDTIMQLEKLSDINELTELFRFQNIEHEFKDQNQMPQKRENIFNHAGQ
jgi:hypothetical protein